MTELITRENPARPDEMVGTVPVASDDAVARAVAAADDAQRDWSRLAVGERSRVLAQASEQQAADDGTTAELLARELGKVLPDCRGELAFARAWLRWVTERAPGVLASREVDDAAGRLVIERRPFGVVAAITPWNAPVVLAMLKVAPALAAGNTVVVKPSPLAPLGVGKVLSDLAAALPAGVLQVVNGGASTGARLVSNRQVRKVAFTGGASTGRALSRLTADTLTPMVLELSGNDPAVVLADAILDEPALERLLFAAFATAGQVCMAIKRLYVHRSRHDELVEGLRTVAERVLALGDPLAEGVTIGPLVTRVAAERVEMLTADARRRGGEVVAVGTVSDPGMFERGYFVRPALVLGIDDGAALVREEQFGPVLPVLTFDTEDEVVRRANDSELGLAASVWSAHEERAFALARRLEAGFRFVNTHNRTGLALGAPFGGVKGSGYGREYGEEGIVEYTQACVVHAPAAFRGGRSDISAAAYPVP